MLFRRRAPSNTTASSMRPRRRAMLHSGGLLATETPSVTRTHAISPDSLNGTMGLRDLMASDSQTAGRTSSMVSPSGTVTAGLLNGHSLTSASYNGDRRLSVNVTRKSLTNATGNGLTRNMLSLLRLPARVSVEATTHDRADSVFYAPFPSYFPMSNGAHHEHPEFAHISPHRPTATEFLTVNPHTDRVENLVSFEDDFELSFVGMNVPPQHSSASNPIELLLYSLRSHVYPDSEDDDHATTASQAGFNPTSANAQDSTLTPSLSFRRNSIKSALGINAVTSPVAESSIVSHIPTVDSPPGTHLLPTDVAFIHYDPVVDGHNEGSLPDTFLPVPASKAVIRQHRAVSDPQAPSNEKGQAMKSSSGSASLVTVRFTVMEVDKVTSAQALAVASLNHMSQTSMNGYTGPGGVVVPYANLISSAVQVANTIGKRALRKYARSDHVMSKDMEFRLVPKAVAKAAAEGIPIDGEQPGVRYAGTYLRVRTHSFYFILISFFSLLDLILTLTESDVCHTNKCIVNR